MFSSFYHSARGWVIISFKKKELSNLYGSYKQIYIKIMSGYDVNASRFVMRWPVGQMKLTEIFFRYKFEPNVG